jgi:hypothetical protein
MSAIKIKCPECGVETEDFTFNVGMDLELCLPCDAKIEYESLERDYQKQWHWLHETFIKRLIETYRKMNEAKEKMERLKRC